MDKWLSDHYAGTGREAGPRYSVHHYPGTGHQPRRWGWPTRDPRTHERIEQRPRTRPWAWFLLGLELGTLVLFASWKYGWIEWLTTHASALLDGSW